MCHLVAEVARLMGVREQGRAAVEFYTSIKTAYVGLPSGMPS